MTFYLTLAIGAAILFAGNGLDASTVTRLAKNSPAFALCLLGAWLMATTPVARALLQAREAQFIKGLPVPFGDIALVLGSFLAVAEFPFALLWFRGAGQWAGAAALVTPLVLHTAWLARPFHRGYAVLAAAVAAFWCLAPPILVTIALAPLFVVFLRAAWMRSPDEAAPSPWSLVRGPPLVALASAHALALARAQFEVIARGALLTTVGAGFAYAILRHGEPSAFAHIASVTQSVSVPVTVALSGTMIGPMLRNERRSRWLLDACAVGASSRAAAIAMVAATLGGSMAGAHALAVSSLLAFDAASRLALTVETAVAGACLSVLTQWCLRFALRDDGRDSARVILSLLAISTAMLLALAVSHRAALVLELLAAAGALAAPRGLPPEPNARRFPAKAAPQGQGAQGER